VIENGVSRKGIEREGPMALTKRGSTWHTHFYVDGERFRKSLDTSDWREAQRKERELVAEAKKGKLMASRDEFSRLPFGEAADRFIADRLPRLAARSVQTERERLKPIKAGIGTIPVWRLTVEQVRTYFRERKAAGRANATLNRELDIIRGVLKRAKRWHHFTDEIRPLPVRENIGRALTYEEKVKLLKRAAARPEWKTAAWAARLALNTTMRGCEIKGLRWRDVDMIGRALTVKRSKTEAGERVIPLNTDAWDVILSLYRRSQELGGFEPGHFLFPAIKGERKAERQGDEKREKQKIDPTRPMKTWRTAWRRLTRAIQCPGCGLLQDPADICSGCEADTEGIKSPFLGFRFHDLRHQVITELAESKASDQTIMGIAGHVSKKMLQHYSHVRMEAKRNALDALTMKPAQRADSGDTTRGYDTKNDTKLSKEVEGIPQMIDSMVELSGIEPLTSSLRTRRSPS
jgi:integrase